MAKKQKELSYNEALEEIKQVISRLESGQISIDDMVVEIEKGAALIQSCKAKLRDVDAKINALFSEKD
jgi:exodeoxyribonuclease VII small subunit